MNLGQRRFGIPNSGLRLVCQPSENRLVDTKTCRRATAPGLAITRGLTESHHTAPNRRGQNESTFLDTATAILKPNGIAASPGWAASTPHGRRLESAGHAPHLPGPAHERGL